MFNEKIAYTSGVADYNRRQQMRQKIRVRIGLQITWTVDGDLKDQSSFNKRSNLLQVGPHYLYPNNWSNVPWYLTKRLPILPGSQITIDRQQIRQKIRIRIGLQITWTVDGDLKDQSSFNKRPNLLQVGPHYLYPNNWTNIPWCLTKRSPTLPGSQITIEGNKWDKK